MKITISARHDGVILHCAGEKDITYNTKEVSISSGLNKQTEEELNKQ